MHRYFKVTARLSMVKVQASSPVPVVEYHRWGNMTSPIEIIQKWTTARGRHPKLFEIPWEPVEWPRKGLTRAMTGVLQDMDIEPTPGGKFTSHSLRIGAHTEKLLVGLPLEVRLARFVGV